MADTKTKKLIQKMEKYLAHYHACSKEPVLEGIVISVQDHYNRMADLVGTMIMIVEGRDKDNSKDELNSRR